MQALRRCGSFLLVTAFAAAVSLPLSADIIALKNGKTVTGDIEAHKDGKIVIKTDTTRITLPESAIDKITTQSPGDKELAEARTLASHGNWADARQACDAAEKAGASPSALAEVRTQIDKIVADENKPMTPLAQTAYNEALQMMDKSLPEEAAADLSHAAKFDPTNIKILHTLMQVHYSLYLDNKTTITDDSQPNSQPQTVSQLLQADGQTINHLLPNDPVASRIMQQVASHDQSVEQQHQTEMTDLLGRIRQEYNDKQWTQQLLDEITQLRTLNPDNTVLAELEKMENDVKAKLAEPASQPTSAPASQPAASQPTVAAAAPPPPAATPAAPAKNVANPANRGGANGARPAGAKGGGAKGGGGGGRKGGGGGGKKGGGKKK